MLTNTMCTNIICAYENDKYRKTVQTQITIKFDCNIMFIETRDVRLNHCFRFRAELIGFISIELYYACTFLTTD